MNIMFVCKTIYNCSVFKIFPDGTFISLRLTEIITQRNMPVLFSAFVEANKGYVEKPTVVDGCKHDGDGIRDRQWEYFA